MTENNFKVDSAAITDKGLSQKRPQNEDSYLELNLRGLFAVADGVGGAQAGDVASQMAVEILAEAFTNTRPNEDAEEVMKMAIEKANQAIYQMSRDLPQLSTMATTIVALHLAGNIATIGHVGDSRLYMLDGNGNLYRKTDDHSVVEEEVRAGRMTVAQAANHPSRNIISRALGAEDSVEVELKTIMFEPNTKFLLCSDGITRHINDFELRDFLIAAENPQVTCQKMKDLCFERGAEDNLTAVIASVSGAVERMDPETQMPFVPEIEEATVATVRSPENNLPDTPNILDLGLDLGSEIPTQQLRRPANDELPPIELEVEGEIPALDLLPEVGQNGPAPVSPETLISEADTSISEADTSEFVFEEPIQGEPQQFEPSVEEIEPEPLAPVQSFPEVSPPVPPPTVKEYEARNYEVSEGNNSTFVSKFLPGIFMFFIGAIIGAGILYVIMQLGSTETPQPQLPAKSQNIVFEEFEQTRRDVDDNPEAFIKSLENAQGKSVEDQYLLGRAYMLMGDFPKAKTALEDAKNRLGEANEQNDTVMADDIAAYLAIIENESSQKFFNEELKRLNKDENGENPGAAESPAASPGQ
ncbi:MAG: PP2C family serine/threonine-protein phosphatase [Pyrinomonadaceae bacterium]